MTLRAFADRRQFAILLFLVAPFVRLPAQGVTAAALDGVVVFADAPGRGAFDSTHVTIINATTGQRLTLTARPGSPSRGRFTAETLAPGGPYTVLVPAPGYPSAQQTGTNTVHGSVFGFMQNDAFVGTDAFGRRPADFTNGSFGLSAGGPIVPARIS